jgi:integrase
VASRLRSGGRLVRQPRRLPESLSEQEVASFLADLNTCRDRAIVLLMLLGGLRSGEVRRLRLADVDQGQRRVRVEGKGGKERVVPVDGLFFSGLAAYLARERPSGLTTPECVVVLRGPTVGQAMTEAGCAASSAVIGLVRARRGYVRTGCDTPTAPSSRPRGWTCWCSASVDGPRSPRPPPVTST